MREKNQVVLPLDLGICIPEGDFVFKVAEICESLDYTELFNTYLRAWRKINPITMFEILVFAYMNRKFSSRDIENLCKTDIRFMWLLNGEPAPSDSTITRFQRGHLAEAIERLFYQFVEKLLLMATSDAVALDAVYETVSASATVGLSRNLTATLNTVGKIIIIVTMYFGRVGPISLAVALGSKSETQNVISEPTEDISIG